MRRRGFSADAINGLKRAYRTLYRSGLGGEEAARELERQSGGCPEIKLITEFLAGSKRGIIR